jgi:hypothetical protein
LLVPERIGGRHIREGVYVAIHRLDVLDEVIDR